MESKETNTEKPKNSNRLDLSRRAIDLGVAGATGGIGGIARKEFQRVSGAKIQGAADRFATRYKNKRNFGSTEQAKEKFSGIGFWVVLGIVIVNWIFDIVCDFSVVLSVITLITGAIVTFIYWFYVLLQGVSMTSRKRLTSIIASIISCIPFLNVLPALAVNLFVMKYMEKSELLMKVASKAQKL